MEHASKSAFRFKGRHRRPKPRTEARSVVGEDWVAALLGRHVDDDGEDRGEEDHTGDGRTESQPRLETLRILASEQPTG